MNLYKYTIQRRDIYGAWEQYLGLEHSDNTPKRSYAVNHVRVFYHRYGYLGSKCPFRLTNYDIQQTVFFPSFVLFIEKQDVVLYFRTPRTPENRTRIASYKYKLDLGIRLYSDVSYYNRSNFHKRFAEPCNIWETCENIQLNIAIFYTILQPYEVRLRQLWKKCRICEWEVRMKKQSSYWSCSLVCSYRNSVI